MQWLASLLMILGTSLGVYGAASAYYVPIDAPADVIQGLTLNDSAGAKLDEAGKIVEVAKKGEALNAPLIATLRANAAGIRGRVTPWKYVRVREFSFARWPGKWFTVAGTAMLLAGAVIARRLRRADTDIVEDERVIPITSDALARLGREIDALIAQAREHHGSTTTLICEATDLFQKRWIAPLQRAQDAFVAKYGIGRAAEPLASLAGAERNLYRAWSAAADGYAEESITSLASAQQYTAATEKKLAEIGA